MASKPLTKELILEIADTDGRIRAVLLNGSRANHEIKPDDLQDYDIVFLVRDFDSFNGAYHWPNKFGEILLQQFPDNMFHEDDISQKIPGFSQLTLFEDGTRIDLSVFPVEKLENDFESDSLTKVWLDRDDLFTTILPPNDSDYHIEKPSQKEFSDTCNEFWWVSTNVAKALARNEVIFAKEIMESVVRPMFMKMIAWEIGWRNNFSVSFGKGGKFISKYLEAKICDEILQTYAGADVSANWESLFIMCDLFQKFSNTVSVAMEFDHTRIEEQNAVLYLKKLYQHRD